VSDTGCHGHCCQAPLVRVIDVEREPDGLAAALDLFCQNIGTSPDSLRARSIKIGKIGTLVIALEAVGILKVHKKGGHRILILCRMSI